ncbi:DUF1329 domain-containing protein [Algiphilus sp. NNCM1]|uniref:DUF1329 domain-containing protein n=1 Tax=Algiphilus sp. TaxID=1872431 RepID=UPI001CA751E2|nr:DUF1329 domain-containing protein [Algiphilus sp.]MBY8966857.1 DUF1329 domain-containing protein [Algiphilus acroporae]MCI5102154.1 DUF1329 domain-containing protein [Algiphilus sp.]
MHKRLSISLLGALVAAMGSATAADYGPEALGQELTPMGAIKAGNEAGTIPPWSGKWQGPPPHIDYDGRYNTDPYPDDEVLYTISVDNMEEYAEVLGPGQKALLRTYPETYRIHVYPTRRDFRRPELVYKNVRRNAEEARLTNDGLTLEGAYGGVAFPIPDNGLEVVYNILTSSAPWFIEAPQVSRFKHANGSVTRSEVFLKVYNPYARGDDREGWEDGDVFSYSLSEERAPPRNAGRITLSSNTYDNSGTPRDAWQFDPGTRRVRKTPDVQFDYPVPQGPRVVDEQNGFNGSPERFDWKLVGKREMVVPFHNYRLESRDLSYDDFIVTEGHPDPQYIRHELRRVWIVEGTLKEDLRHVYGKRRFYVEEDSWHKVMGDMYDTRGELWRVSFDGMIYAYDAEGYYNNVSIYQDLTSRAYSIEKLNNEAAIGTRLNRREPLPGEFSPAGLRRAGG